jgi:hypothetical protein
MAAIYSRRRARCRMRFPRQFEIASLEVRNYYPFMRWPNVSQVLFAGLLLVCGRMEAATLRANFLFDGQPGRLAVQVTQGRITAVEVIVPQMDLPPPYDVFDFGTSTTYNGAPGREFEEILSPRLTSKAVLRYSNISRSQSREFQSEEKTYTYAGTQTTFYPDDHSPSVVTAQNLTPYSNTASGTARFNATVTRKLLGKALEMRLEHYTENWSPLVPISIDWITLKFSRTTGDGEWNVKILLGRPIMHGDVGYGSIYTATARLHGRAGIDPSFFGK